MNSKDLYFEPERLNNNMHTIAILNPVPITIPNNTTKSTINYNLYLSIVAVGIIIAITLKK